MSRGRILSAAAICVTGLVAATVAAAAAATSEPEPPLPTWVDPATGRVMQEALPLHLRDEFRLPTNDPLPGPGVYHLPGDDVPQGAPDG